MAPAYNPPMLRVLSDHPGFRRLWLAQVVSQAGDWLNRIAVLALIGELGGAEAAAGVGALFGFELALRLVPGSLFGPFAGPAADRLPRRAVMIVTDLLRAGVVLGMLTIDRSEELPILYALLLGQSTLAVFFNSARAGAVPSTVSREDLHLANALSSATWSIMLAVVRPFTALDRVQAIPLAEALRVGTQAGGPVRRTHRLHPRPVPGCPPEGGPTGRLHPIAHLSWFPEGQTWR